MKKEELHIGKIVETAFNQSGITKTKFAEAIGVHLQNLNREFANADWSVMKLKKAGKMIKPAVMATKVSRRITFTDSPMRERSLPM